MLILVLVVGAVKTNPGLPTEQDKLDQILAHMASQENERKVTQKLLQIQGQ
jgi:hypothetical protein